MYSNIKYSYKVPNNLLCLCCGNYNKGTINNKCSNCATFQAWKFYQVKLDFLYPSSRCAINHKYSKYYYL